LWRNERLFHHRALEYLITDLDDLMFENRTADRGNAALSGFGAVLMRWLRE
jgi:hypothetical protein